MTEPMLPRPVANSWMVFLTLALASCADLAHPMPREVSRTPAGPISTLFVTATRTPVIATNIPFWPPTPTTILETPDAIVGSSTLPEPHWATHCLAVTSNSTRAFSGTGYLGLESRNNEKPYAFAFVTGEKILLRANWFAAASYSSPDEHWLVRYMDTVNPDRVQVLSPQGEVTATFDLVGPGGFWLKRPFIEYDGWLDNERLVFFYRDDANHYPYSTLVYNPFTGQHQDLSPTYPDMYSFVPDRYHPVTPRIAYDATLTRVVYPFFVNDDKVGFRLWDIPNQHLLAEIPVIPDTVDPVWSPDSRQVALLGLTRWPYGSTELFAIDREGEVDQLTYFSETAGIESHSYRWSPDGRHIAFQLLTRQDDGSTIGTFAVLDVKAREVTNYCIPVYNSLNRDSFLWSPDSHQLAVESTVAISSSTGSRLVVVNINQNTAFELGKNVMPVFWLRTLPLVWRLEP